jgi:DNA-binding NarL/FixJ family response regulator
MRRHRILIVDPAEQQRMRLRSILSLDPAIDIVGDVASGHEAMAAIRRTRPDLALISRALPGLSGPCVASTIRLGYPWVRVLLMTAAVDYDQLEISVACGAAAAMSRDADRDTILSTVRGVLTGQFRLLHWPVPEIDEPAAPPPNVIRIAGEREDSALTERELGVLDCLLIGESTKDAARSLGVTEVTVRKLVSSIIHKLDVGGRIGAINLAVSKGWCEITQPRYQGENNRDQIGPGRGSMDNRAGGRRMQPPRQPGFGLPPTALA